MDSATCSVDRPPYKGFGIRCLLLRPDQVAVEKTLPYQASDNLLKLVDGVSIAQSVPAGECLYVAVKMLGAQLVVSADISPLEH